MNDLIKRLRADGYSPDSRDAADELEQAQTEIEQLQGHIARYFNYQYYRHFMAVEQVIVRNEQLEAELKNAYETGYQDSADMHSMSDENVPEEMKIGWGTYFADK